MFSFYSKWVDVVLSKLAIQTTRETLPEYEVIANVFDLAEENVVEIEKVRG